MAIQTYNPPLHPPFMDTLACPDNLLPDVTEGVNPRRRRSTRSFDHLPPYRLTKRDVSILEDIWAHRLLTTSQIAILRQQDRCVERRFVSRYTLQRRLQGMFHHGYVNRIQRPAISGSSEPAYVLDKKGARELAETHGEVRAVSASHLPREAALDHLIAINQVRVCLAANTLDDGGLELTSWKSGNAARFGVWLQERGTRREKARFIPDGCITLRVSSGRLHCFLEVDRGTEPLNTIGRKCLGYYTYWQTKGFATDFQVDERMGFRVLFIAPTARRAESILTTIERYSGPTGLFWVALAADITPGQIATPIFREASVEHPQCLTT